MWQQNKEKGQELNELAASLGYVSGAAEVETLVPASTLERLEVPASDLADLARLKAHLRGDVPPGYQGMTDDDLPF